MNINSANTNTLSGVISDGASGQVAITQSGAGITILTNTETYTGATTVNAGTRVVNGSLAAGTTVTVNSGGPRDRRHRHDQRSTVNVLSGGHFNPGGINTSNGSQIGGTLTIGNLVLSSGSTTDFSLQTAGVAGGVNDLVNVATNLTLGGNLDINELPGFGIGSYTLFTYGGTLAGSFGSTIGGLNGFNASISTGVNGQVNLVVALGNAQFWDGNGVANDNNIAGGSGTWNATSTNWTDNAGAVNAKWGGGTAIFNAPGGTVTLGSAISAQGLVFGSNGYVLTGSNTLTLTGTAPEINVSSAGGSATVGVRIAGTSGLTADGVGTLILTNGSNSYSGGTNVGNGTLQVGTTATTGSLGGGAISLFSGGTLSVVNVTGSVLAANVSGGVSGHGTLNVNSAKSNTLSGALTDGSSGQLALTQSGAGTTILTNSGNTYSGSTTVSGGILQVGTSTIAGSIGSGSAISIGNGGTLTLVKLSNSTFANSVTDGLGGTGTLNINSTGNLTLSGVLSDGSSGQLNLLQSGTGTTTLTGIETYTGATTVNAGTLQIGNGSSGNLAAGSAVTVANTGTLAIDLSNGTNKATFAADVTLNGAGATLKVIDSSTDTFTGVIGGTGVWARPARVPSFSTR